MGIFHRSVSHTGLAIAVGIAATLGSAMAADQTTHKFVKSANFTIAPFGPKNEIIVLSKDGGKTWSHIAPDTIRLLQSSNIDVRYPGQVDQFRMYLGQCFNNTANCDGLPVLTGGDNNPKQRDFQSSYIVEINPADLPKTPFGPHGTNYFGEIIENCNAAMEQLGSHEDRIFPMKMKVALSALISADHAQLNENGGFGSEPGNEIGDYPLGDYIRYAEMSLPVRCIGFEPYDPPDDDHGTPVPNEDFSVERVDLFLSTFSHAVTHPDENTTCKRGRILARARTNKEGPVAFRLHTLGVDGAGAEFVETWSHHVGSGVYEAELTRWVETDHTTDLQAMVEVEQGIFDLSTNWKSLPLECITDTPDFSANPGSDDSTPEPDSRKRKFGKRYR